MADNLQIGAHESIAGGLNKAIERIESVGGNCLQIFTKNSRFWAAKPLAPDAVEAFKAAWAASEVQDVVVHDSYLINLCSDREEIVEKSISALTDELVRTHQLGIPYLVMHPGSHVGQGEEQGIEMVARHLNRIFEETPECRDVQLLL
ncbi:MAG: TIM barrel protein, partial [Deltaproteobacteria bacterium]|nr:TIM barrel protein [Deltaproteobacteria bacterium]